MKVKKESARNALKQFLMRESEALYSEYQLPPLWHLFLALLVTSSLGIAYGSAISLLWGWIVGLSLSSVALWWWVSKGIRIIITRAELQVGKFSIERAFIGQAETYAPTEFMDRIRSGAHRDDVFLLRGVRTGGVAVELKDSRDPFCHWVFTAKNPSKIVELLKVRDF